MSTYANTTLSTGMTARNIKKTKWNAWSLVVQQQQSWSTTMNKKSEWYIEYVVFRINEIGSFRRWQTVCAMCWKWWRCGFPYSLHIIHLFIWMGSIYVYEPLYFSLPHCFVLLHIANSFLHCYFVNSICFFFSFYSRRFHFAAAAAVAARYCSIHTHCLFWPSGDVRENGCQHCSCLSILYIQSYWNSWRYCCCVKSTSICVMMHCDLNWSIELLEGDKQNKNWIRYFFCVDEWARCECRF